MTVKQIEERIAQLGRNGGAFYSITTHTTPKLTAKNRTTKVPTAFKVEIRSRIVAKLGVSYENICNNRLEKQGLPRDFEAQKPFGKHYITGSKFLMEADKDPTKHYLAVDGISTTERHYFIDGREATPEEVEDLKANYLPVPSKHPLNVTWRTYGVEGVVEIN